MKTCAVVMMGLVALATSGCSAADGNGRGEAAGRVSEAIIGGKVNATETAVGQLQAWTGDTGSYCSSTLVAPNVVLTAAHCLEGTNAETKAYVSFDTTPSDDVTKPDWKKVASMHVHPDWGTTYINYGHDCAVIVLEQPVVGVTPKLINTDPIDATFNGINVRILGFGVTDGVAQTGDGTRREVDTTLDDFVDGVIEVGASGHTSCQGDSGGPTFATVKGVEKQIGITSYGEENCAGKGSMTRVDMCADWIKTFF